MTTTIEVFADIWCPFAHVGLREARRVRDASGRDDVTFLIRPWPLELVNGVGLDPQVTARHVHELREQVAPELFIGFDQNSFPRSTLPALALVSAGYDRDVATGEALSWTLRDALFESGLDISDPGLLLEVAESFDLGDHEVGSETIETQWHQGQARGVKGSPHFFCGTHDAFCPALDISRDELGDLTLRTNAQRLSAFLHECLTLGEAYVPGQPMQPSPPAG